MATLRVSLAAPWPPLYFSYAFIAGIVLLGLLFPAWAPVVLAPVLVVGLVGLGLAHGACDQLVLPALHPAPRQPGRRMGLFVLGYLGLAAVAGLGWWCWPAGAVAAFLLLTVWHWGSADAPAQPTQQGAWFIHSLLRGSLFFAVPVRWWPVEAQCSINGLLALAGGSPWPPAQFKAFTTGLWVMVVVGHLGLWGYYGRQRQGTRARVDAGEVSLLTALFIVLPPLLAIGSYFVFWHSLQHALRLNRLLGCAAATDHLAGWQALGSEILLFIRRALPLLTVSLVALASLYYLVPMRQRGSESPWLSLALVAAAVLTLPHAVLVSVVMDAANWRRAGGNESVK